MERNDFQGIGSEYEALLGAFEKDNERFKKRMGAHRTLSSHMIRMRVRHPLSIRCLGDASHIDSESSLSSLFPDLQRSTKFSSLYRLDDATLLKFKEYGIHANGVGTGMLFDVVDMHGIAVLANVSHYLLRIPCLV